MGRGGQAAVFALGSAVAVAIVMFVITGMPARAGVPADDVTVTDTATVTESSTQTVTATETETATTTTTATATRSLTATATDTTTAHRTTTRVLPLPGSTITRTLPGGTVVTTVVATPPTSPTATTGISAAFSLGGAAQTPTSQRSIWSLWPYLLAMLLLVAAGLVTWALTSSGSRSIRGVHH